MSYTIISSGTAQGLVVGASDALTVEAGGTVVDTLVQGGALYVRSGGLASNTTIAGGVEEVLWGGVATGTRLEPGGILTLEVSPFSGVVSTTFNAASDVLTITEGAVVYQNNLSGDYTGEYFHVTHSDGGPAFYGYTSITVDSTPCYCRGTRILTGSGEIAIEELQVGDCVVTHAGALRPIVWIGRRSYAGRFAASNAAIHPVLIRAGALAAGIPARDLWVSPCHAMLLDGLLVPAGALVNGASIVKTTGAALIDYFHVELATHDVIWAEGAASETFLDDDNRALFHNASDRQPGRQPAAYCAPRVEHGYALEAIRHRLAAHAHAA